MFAGSVSEKRLALCLGHSRGCILAILKHRAGLCPGPGNSDSLVLPEAGAAAQFTEASNCVPNTGARTNWGRGEGEGEHRAAAHIFEVGKENKEFRPGSRNISCPRGSPSIISIPSRT